MQGRALFMALLFLGAHSTASAGACSQRDNAIATVGVDDSEGSVYMNMSAHNNACGCNYFRFKAANTQPDSILAVLIAAKLANKVVRVDAREYGDCNSAYRAYFD